MKKIFLSLLIIYLSTSLSAQENFNNLSSYFDSIEKYHLFSGSVELRKSNDILFKRQFGFANACNEVTEDTKFRIGSISKTFTATLIMKAVDEKKIKLTDKLSKYFPSIPNSKNITIENLLRHTAGLFNYTNDSLFWTHNQEAISHEQMLTLINGYPSQFKPGTQYEYSNTGYYLLARILEKVYQQNYAVLLEQKITIPLGLKNTYEGKSIDVNNNEATSIRFIHYKKQWIDEPMTHSSHLLGAGGIISTPTDLNTFYINLLTGKLLSENSLKAMKTLKFNYGFGLIPTPYKLNVGLGHTGGIDNYSSFSGYFESDSLAFSITLNGYLNGINDIAIAMLASYYGDPIKMPSAIIFYNIPTEKLDKYVGDYYNTQYKTQLLVEKDFEQNSLKVKLQNQPFISLIPTQINIFEYPMVDAKFTFNSDKKTVTLNQFGNKIEFKMK